MLTLQDAKNRFSAVVEAALAGHPQEVSRRGKPAVVVLSIEEYRQLVSAAQRARPSFKAHLKSFPGLPDEDETPRMDLELRDIDL